MADSTPPSQVQTSTSNTQSNVPPSRYHGVHMHKGKWIARIYSLRYSKTLWLGSYSMPEMAAIDYDMGALACNRDNAVFNFPDAIQSHPVPKSASIADIRAATIEAATKFGVRAKAVDAFEVASQEIGHHIAWADWDKWLEYSGICKVQVHEQVQKQVQIVPDEPLDYEDRALRMNISSRTNPWTIKTEYFVRTDHPGRTIGRSSQSASYEQIVLDEPLDDQVRALHMISSARAAVGAKAEAGSSSELSAVPSFPNSARKEASEGVTLEAAYQSAAENHRPFHPLSAAKNRHPFHPPSAAENGHPFHSPSAAENRRPFTLRVRQRTRILSNNTLTKVSKELGRCLKNK
ncbi:hypothetical protein IEQ34_003422 [Dendrobium chrysotoxum]|uniref:AP2/ERF domain-containing protein n=1 Tax=Dendrobium chrysotoxum TaxID=161865 RepID=A0AAV7H3Q1_DENCH|nr:hypothetical protein IEQ34_003422 [Dendrobium chrysotoxum]